MAKDALAIAADLRRRSLELQREAAQLLTIAMLADGTHYSLPDHLHASAEEREARLTPEQRAEFHRRMAQWEARRR